MYIHNRERKIIVPLNDTTDLDAQKVRARPTVRQSQAVISSRYCKFIAFLSCTFRWFVVSFLLCAVLFLMIQQHSLLYKVAGLMALVLSGSDKSRIQEVAELTLFFRNVRRIFDRRGLTQRTVKRNCIIFNVLGLLSDVLLSGHPPATPIRPCYFSCLSPARSSKFTFQNSTLKNRSGGAALRLTLTAAFWYIAYQFYFVITNMIFCYDSTGD